MSSAVFDDEPKRNNKIIIPTGDDHLVIGDRVIVVTKNSNLLTLDDIIFGGAN